MSACLNGGEKGQFQNLDGIDNSNMIQKGSANAPSSKGRWMLTGCGVLYMLLLTAVAVIAFILGCYSANIVRKMPDSDVFVVTDPRSASSLGYSVYSLGTGLGYWSPKTDMKHSRSDHGVISYGRYAYLVGGLSENVPGKGGVVLDSVVKYDMDTGDTQEMTPLRESRQRFAYALLGDQIYVMGGVDSNAPDAIPSDKTFVYNITSDKSSNGGQLNIARVDPCAATVGGKIYVFGGYDANGRSLTSVEVLDPATRSPTAAATFTLLSTTSNLITSRGDCRATAVDGIIYVVGGVEWYQNPTKSCDGNLWFNCYHFLSSVEAFDPVTQKWSSRAPMVNPRGDFGIEAISNGRIIVAGGERTNGEHNSIAMYEVEEYIVEDDVWVQKAPLPEARFRADLGHFNDRVFAFGGVPTCGISSNYSDACPKIALKTVFSNVDVQYPRLYASYRKSASSSSSTSKNTTNRRLMA